MAGSLIWKKPPARRDTAKTLPDKPVRTAVEVTELSTHLQGQLVAVHPAYDTAFDGFAAPEVRGNPAARQAWAVDQVKQALTASRNLGITAHATFSGALAWPYIYPWPQRPAGLIETAFDELAKRWRPILDYADDMGVDVCYEIHPGRGSS
jgi:sugar phosphate isomerase/epimerase